MNNKIIFYCKLQNTNLNRNLGELFMKKLIIVLIMLIIYAFFLGGKTVPLPDLVRPHCIAVDAKQIYITEGSTVFIYSLKDFKLVKKFGKNDEGPQGFKGMIRFVNARPNQLYFNSSGKASYFSKDGRFIKEFRIPFPDMKIKPLGDDFVGGRVIFEKKLLYLTINLYGANLKKIKDLHRQMKSMQPGGKGLKIFSHVLPFHTEDNKLYIANRKGFEINVFDTAGTKLHSISYDYKNITVPVEVKKQVIHFLKTSTQNARYFKQMQPITFPDYFPAILQYYVSDSKVYVVTYYKEEGKNEVLVFDKDGKFSKRTFAPYGFRDPIDAYPAAVDNGKLYQLIENNESEEWELRISHLD